MVYVRVTSPLAEVTVSVRAVNRDESEVSTEPPLVTFTRAPDSAGTAVTAGSGLFFGQSTT
jgi:hypothetical protein